MVAMPHLLFPLGLVIQVGLITDILGLASVFLPSEALLLI